MQLGNINVFVSACAFTFFIYCVDNYTNEKCERVIALYMHVVKHERAQLFFHDTREAMKYYILLLEREHAYIFRFIYGRL